MKKFFLFIAFCAVAFGAIYLTKQPTLTVATDLSSTQPATDPSKFINKHQQLMDLISTKILAIQTKKDIKSVVSELNKISTDNPEFIGPKIMAGIANFLNKMEGIVWRSRGIVEPSDWLHSTALFQLRNFANYNYLYGQHIEALFNFLVDPPEDTKAKPMFTKLTQLTGFLNSKEIVGDLESQINLLKSADGRPSYEFVFDFDRRIINGIEDGLPLIDKDEAKRKFIKPYIYTLTFLFQRLAATIHYVDPINMNDLPKFSNAMLRKTTLNMIENKIKIPLFGREHAVAPGVTPMMLYKTMDEHKDFLTLRKGTDNSYAWAQYHWKKAFDLNVEAARYQLAAFVCGITYPEQAQNGSYPTVTVSTCNQLNVNEYKNKFLEDGDKYIFNPNRMLIDLKQKYKAIRDRAVAHSQNQKGTQYVPITSDVTGQTLMVNIKAVYTIPRNGDLKSVYLPASYELEKSPGRNVGDTWAWNYNHGKPQTFKDPTFNGFFQDGSDVYRNMTTLMYTDALVPFAIWLRVPNPTRFISVPW